jgi:hypothetical protein
MPRPQFASSGGGDRLRGACVNARGGHGFMLTCRCDLWPRSKEMPQSHRPQMAALVVEVVYLCCGESQDGVDGEL